MRHHFKHLTFQSRRRQRGVVSTLIAVVVLLVTLLAAVALLRSVDTSNTLAGNIAFKQLTTQEAEYAYKDVLNNLGLFSGQPGAGEADLTVGTGPWYFASLQPVDNRGVPTVLLTLNYGMVPANYTGQDKIHYVVERMCPQAGPALTVAPNQCVVPGATVTGGSTSGNQGGFAGSALAGYRLTVRIDGPKGATTYVQTILH